MYNTSFFIKYRFKYYSQQKKKKKKDHIDIFSMYKYGTVAPMCGKDQRKDEKHLW